MYEELQRGLGGGQRDILEAWIAARGERGWPQKLAEQMRRAPRPGQNGATFKQIGSRIYRSWYAVRDRIYECFGLWLQASAEANGQPEARQALENRDNLAGAVLPLILTYGRAVRPPDGLTTAGAPPGPKSPVQDADPEQARLHWLRGQQRDLMYDRARQWADRRLHDILKGYRDGKTSAALMDELYGAADPTAAERFDKDRDLLHAWYEQITREKRPTLDAWSFYDGMRHQGFRKFRDRAAARAEFRPIVEAAEKGAPYPALPDRLGVDWEELAARVLRLRDLVLPPRDESKRTP